MKKVNGVATRILIVTFLLSLVGCAGMSSRDKSTAIGAGIGQHQLGITSSWANWPIWYLPASLNKVSKLQ